MKPSPWSHTALEAFVNCPRAYHAKYVVKTVKELPTDMLIWGREVHKHFEDRQAFKTPLPKDLAMHELFMKELEDAPGHDFMELKIAFDTKCRPTHYWDRDVWCRGGIDYLKVNGTQARIVDYKTGKPHSKFDQLSLFALHTFAMYPDVQEIAGQYYWTQTQSLTEHVWHRGEIKDMWMKFLPNLKQYATAFKTDTWQPRQSGLCKKHCAVTDCEFNGRR